MGSQTFSLKRYIAQENIAPGGKISIIVATFAMTMLSMALPLATLHVYDRVLSNPDNGTLVMLLWGVFAALLCECALRLARAYVLEWSGVTFVHKLQTRLFWHVLHADYRYGKNREGIARSTQSFGSVDQVKDFHTGQILSIYAELFFLPLFFIVISIIAGGLVIVPMTIVLVYVMVSYHMTRQLKPLHDERDEHDAQRYDFLVETLNIIHTIKAFAAEKLFQRRYEQLKENVDSINIRVARHYNHMATVSSLTSSLMMVCSVFVGASLVLQGDMTMGALIATILLTGRIMQPVQKAMSIWTKSQHYDKARDEIEDMFSTPLLKTSATVTADHYGVVHIDNISFRYHPTQPWILNGLSLSLNPGDAIAISGGQGSGKTTFLHLLAGMYPPTQGMILIDGQPVTSFDQQDIVTHVGLLETQGVIFRGTIRDNITRFGLTPEQDAQTISRLLGINDEAAKLPAGLNTMLDGVDSDSLPPGFKQKIAIARALAPNPKVVLFDEAERDLDIFGYHLLYRLLAKMKGQVTLILMTEDKNLQSLADRRYRLVDGALVEDTAP